jgi:hypothetical protein
MNIDRCRSFNVVRHDSWLGSIIENKWENTCINKFVMENEPLFKFQYQYAQKQGLNLSNSLGLEVREEKLNLTSKKNILKVENKILQSGPRSGPLILK